MTRCGSLGIGTDCRERKCLPIGSGWALTSKRSRLRHLRGLIRCRMLGQNVPVLCDGDPPDLRSAGFLVIRIFEEGQGAKTSFSSRIGLTEILGSIDSTISPPSISDSMETQRRELSHNQQPQDFQKAHRDQSSYRDATNQAHGV